jgi:hypothetical protein
MCGTPALNSHREESGDKQEAGPLTSDGSHTWLHLN